MSALVISRAWEQNVDGHAKEEVKMSAYRTKPAIAAAILASVSITAWAMQAHAVERGGTITLSIPAPVQTLDPHKVVSHESYPATFHIFSALTRIGRDFGAEPELATSWEPNNAATVWTFHLDENAKFTNGRAVTAEDVKFSLERVLDKTQSPRGYGTIGPIASVRAEDAHTVVIKLRSPYLDLPIDLGGIYPRVVAKENIDEISTRPVGSGPFKLKKYDPAGVTVLERNPAYHIRGEDGQTLPYVDEVRLVPIQEPNSEMAALKTGSIDVMLQLPYDLFETATEDPNIVVGTTASGYHSLILNLASDFPNASHANELKFFKDKRVREAFALIIDREAALALALGGHGVIGNDQPIPPYHVYAHANLPPRTQDIEAAKRLLAAAGVPKGATFNLYTTAGRPGLKEIALAFREMAKKVDLDIRVEVIEVARYWKEFEYKAPFYTDNWGARQTINASVKPFYVTGGSNNTAHLSDLQLDKVLNAAESEVDVVARKALYNRAMEMIADHAVTVIPYFKAYYVAKRANIEGVDAHPMTYMWLDRTWRRK